MDETFAKALSRYADVAIQIGVNLQPGQRLLIHADITAAPLVREITRSAYQVGSRYVDVFWSDQQITLARFQYAPRDSFTEYPDWMVSAGTALVDAGAARISVSSADPDLLHGQDPQLISVVQQTAAQKNRPMMDRVLRNQLNWAVVAAPSPGWAKKMFASLPDSERETQLWNAIFAACRIDQPDPVNAWRIHLADLAARSTYLNAKRYHALHYTAPGTDLTVGLAEGHRWISGGMKSENGIEFVANLPTEEVFTAPHRARINGVVRATKPLNLGGSLISDFSLVFRDGRVTDIQATKGEDVLRKLIATDEGAASLGEVALVPENSPIAQSKRLFYNTLFDENAACHLALGAAYQFTVDGGTSMSAEEFAAIGGNASAVHTDFMISSAETDIDGITAEGTAEPLMRQGNWAFHA